MLPVAFVGVGLLIALTFGYLQSTVVKGIEFDTKSWTTRSFWYRRDPFSGSQLTGILRENPVGLNGTAVNFPSSYFNAPSAAAARWEMVELRSGTVITEGPANVLYSYFKGLAAEQLWTDWSSANVLKANELWSAARDLVDIELYHELPKIMELARVESTDAEFKSLIEQKMRTILTAQFKKLLKPEIENDENPDNLNQTNRANIENNANDESAANDEDAEALALAKAILERYTADQK